MTSKASLNSQIQISLWTPLKIENPYSASISHPDLCFLWGKKKLRFLPPPPPPLLTRLVSVLVQVLNN